MPLFPDHCAHHYLNNYMVVVLHADPATEEAYLTQLAQQLLSAKFAATAR